VAFLDQDFPSAIAYADAYLSQVPDGAEGYALKGACLKFLGQQEAGDVLINKARELNPHVRRYREP
jgi:Flp pilus assembly protein TadD